MKWEKVKAGEYQWDDYSIHKFSRDWWDVWYKDERIDTASSLANGKVCAEVDFKKRLDAWERFGLTRPQATRESQVQA